MAERKKTVERLEELLNEKDEELEAMQAKVEEWEAREAYRWTRHRIVYNNPGEEDDAPNLPVPRLQLRYEKLTDDGYSFRVVYELVYRHYCADLKGCEKFVYVPMGETRINGGGILGADEHGKKKLHLPMRDSCHIAWDGRQLKLPMFALYEDHIEELKTEDILRR